MDNIQSWSSFEQHQRQRSKASEHGLMKEIAPKDGFDALYVSPSASNIAQSAASLLREAGLSDNDDEFKLKFHWMRPHPTLAFQIEDEWNKDSSGGDGGEEEKTDNEHSNDELHQMADSAIHPAVEASRLMKAHRYSQETNFNQQENNDSDMSPEQIQHHGGRKRSLDLPIEMPKLRINLANLVEPPLMTSWLPGEDAAR